MKKRFTETPISFALRQADSRTPVGEITRKLGISEATFYRWMKNYAGLEVAEMRRLKQMEDENRRLKQLVADLTLDKQMLQDVLKKSSEACRATRSGARAATGVSDLRNDARQDKKADSSSPDGSNIK